MANTYYGVNSFPGSVSVPVNGEVADAADADAIWQTALDRTVALGASIADRAAVRVRGSRPGTLTVGPLSGILVFEGSTPRLVSTSSNLTVSWSATPGWMYLYAYVNAGSPAFETSTTAPDANRLFKTGDTSRRYLCPLKIDSGGRLLSFSFVGGRYLYTSTPHPLTASLSPVAGIAEGSFAALVPPTSRVALGSIGLFGPVGMAGPGGLLPRIDERAWISPHINLSDSQTILVAIAPTTVGSVQYIPNANGVTVQHQNIGAGQPLAVQVVGSLIRVTLGTDGGGTVTSTIQQVVDAVAEHGPARALLAAIGNAGAPENPATTAGVSALTFSGGAMTLTADIQGFLE